MPGVGGATRAARSSSCAPRLPRGHLKRGRGERGASEEWRGGDPSREEGERRAGPGAARSGDEHPRRGRVPCPGPAAALPAEGGVFLARPEGLSLSLTGAGVISYSRLLQDRATCHGCSLCGLAVYKATEESQPEPSGHWDLGFGVFGIWTP